VRKLGDVGTHFKFENEQVRIWDLILQPGESSDWHKHSMRYLFVVVEPGVLKAEYDDGSSQEREYVLGEVVMGQKDSVHRVTNSGNTRWRNAIVEIKQ